MSRSGGLKQKYELSEEEKHFTTLERFKYAPNRLRNQRISILSAMNMLEQQIEYTNHAIALLESIKLKPKAGASGAAIHEEFPGD
jgi:hypothetical protein